MQYCVLVLDLPAEAAAFHHFENSLNVVLSLIVLLSPE